MTDISRIVSVVQIRGIRLLEASCRSLVRASEIPETMHVESSQDAAVDAESANRGSRVIRVALQLEIRDDGDEGSVLAEIRATFELSYAIPEDETFSAEEWEAFAGLNAVFNAWPYWREFVQTSLARMGFPVLTVPVFRVMPRDQVDDSAEADEVPG